ncbi:MAG TPA: 30S ribosomal protein S5 [Tepiditoga sp.]|nr:30S ribosomal protein S5 [Thermotogota bacterium]HOO74033.1 30S ribosomal protein S5 [Tepiditoga sp.]
MAFNKNVKATDVAQEFEEKIIEIRRVTKVTTGGKTISFRVVAVVGNKNGKVGVGIGNAREVPQAIRKSIDNAKKAMVTVPVKNGTIPHEIRGRQDSSKIMLMPAAPGTGIIASAPVRAVVELAGVTNILTKSLGSTTVLNLAQATLNGLEALKSPEKYAELRDISVKQVFKGAHREG